MVTNPGRSTRWSLTLMYLTKLMVKLKEKLWPSSTSIICDGAVLQLVKDSVQGNLGITIVINNDQQACHRGMFSLCFSGVRYNS